MCCGSTEAMMATLLGIFNNGEEVVIFEPFYENYGPDSILSGASRASSPASLKSPEAVELRSRRIARSLYSGHSQTKAIIVNTPNNPTGKVFSRKSWN